MLTAKQIKQIHSLKQKKFREIHRRFLAEGSKLVLDVLDSRYKVAAVYALPAWLQENEKILLTKNIPFTEISEGEMGRITALSSPCPVLAEVEIPETPILPVSAANDLILVLDDIKDPGNLGTIIRIADWFGIRSIVCSENTVDLYNPKVIQATMGSVARVRVDYLNLMEFLSTAGPGRKIYGAAMQGNNIFATQLDANGILVIGSESNGISPEVSSKITDTISIPFYSKSPGQHHAESLNASVATAIICAEFRRRDPDYSR